MGSTAHTIVTVAGVILVALLVVVFAWWLVSGYLGERRRARAERWARLQVADLRPTPPPSHNTDSSVRRAGQPARAPAIPSTRLARYNALLTMSTAQMQPVRAQEADPRPGRHTT